MIMFASIGGTIYTSARGYCHIIRKMLVRAFACAHLQISTKVEIIDFAIVRNQIN